MRVVGGDWPLGSQVVVRGDRLKVLDGPFRQSVLKVSALRDIEGVSPHTLGQLPPSVRSAAGLVLGKRQRGQVVLITADTGRLLLVECGLREVQALLRLSARMNVAQARAAADTPQAAAAPLFSPTAPPPAPPQPQPQPQPQPLDALTAPSAAEGSSTSDRRPWIVLGVLSLLGCGLVALCAAPPAQKAAPPPAPSPQAVEAAAAASHAAEEASFMKTRAEIGRLATPCDKALASFARPQSQLNGYRSAMRAQSACGASAQALLALKFQAPIPNDAREALDQVTWCYGMAYGQKANSLDIAKRVLNGDQRPSEVIAFRSDMQDAVARVQACGDTLAALEAKYAYLKAPLTESLGRSHHGLIKDAEREALRRKAQP